MGSANQLFLTGKAGSGYRELKEERSVKLLENCPDWQCSFLRSECNFLIFTFLEEPQGALISYRPSFSFFFQF